MRWKQINPFAFAEINKNNAPVNIIAYMIMLDHIYAGPDQQLPHFCWLTCMSYHSGSYTVYDNYTFYPTQYLTTLWWFLKL